MRLWVDDIRRPPDESWVWARTNDEAIDIFATRTVTECSLDHDMGLHDYDPDEQDADLRVAADRWHYEDGVDLVRWMCEHHCIPGRVVIHSWNPPGAERMAALLRSACRPEDLDLYVRPYSRDTTFYEQIGRPAQVFPDDCLVVVYEYRRRPPGMGLVGGPKRIVVYHACWAEGGSNMIAYVTYGLGEPSDG